MNAKLRLHEHLSVLADSDSDIDRLQYLSFATDDLRGLDPDQAVAALVDALKDSDVERRCWAVELLLRVEGRRAIPFLLPLLQDPEPCVRWNLITDLMPLRDELLIDPLLETLQHDADAGVRGSAAHALGLVGSLKAIPALLKTVEKDQEQDTLGHSPSSCAAGALDEIVGTSYTRIKVSGSLCKLAPWPPDLDSLKRRAREVYEEWASGRLTEPRAQAEGPRE